MRCLQVWGGSGLADTSVSTTGLDEGKLGLYIREQETMLEEGDAIYFDSSQQHGYRRVGRRRCRALVVVAPSTGDAA